MMATNFKEALKGDLKEGLVKAGSQHGWEWLSMAIGHDYYALSSIVLKITILLAREN